MMSGASPVLVPREDPVGKILFAVAALIFGLAFFVALMTLMAAVFRGQTGRCRATLQQTPYRALALGAFGYLVLAGLARYVYSFAFIRRLLETEIVPSMLALCIALVAVLVIITFAGATGTFAAVGDRLEALHGQPMSGLTKVALGTLVAVLAGWFPVVGWCLVIPALAFFAFGSAALSLLPVARRQASVTKAPAAVPEPARVADRAS